MGQYCFSGKTPKSARTDLTLYLPNDTQMQVVANVEFKEGTPRCNQHKKIRCPFTIRKDIKKLLKEIHGGHCLFGNWFHILESVDSRGIPQTFDALRDAILHPGPGLSKIRDEIRILICVCVLKQKWACLKEMCYSAQKNGKLELYLDDFFNGLKLTHTLNTITTLRKGGWEILEP